MGKYMVIRPFRDAKDEYHVYRAGDTYPREGYNPSKKRIDELTSDKNRLGKPVIVEGEGDE